MTLHDDLTRTAALLRAGWPITNLARARRVAQRNEHMSNASNAARELTCDDGLTNDEISSLAATKSEAEWNAACNAIKKARGGMYPRDWWPLVQMSGFMARQVASWKEAK